MEVMKLKLSTKNGFNCYQYMASKKHTDRLGGERGGGGLKNESSTGVGEMAKWSSVVVDREAQRR